MADSSKPCLFCYLVRQALAMPYAAILLMLIGGASLVTAFTAQMVFLVEPCILCLFQRMPYALVILLGALALSARPWGKRAQVFLWLAALTFLAGMGLAFYHTGVEQHWWQDSVMCNLSFYRSSSPADLVRELESKPPIPCDVITWSFLGFSMANWNVLFSFFLAVYAALAAIMCGKPTTTGSCPICSCVCCGAKPFEKKKP